MVETTRKGLLSSMDHQACGQAAHKVLLLEEICLAAQHHCEMGFKSLSPCSDENEIYLYIVNACSNIQVMRIKKVITKDKMS